MREAEVRVREIPGDTMLLALKRGEGAIAKEYNFTLEIFSIVLEVSGS